MEELKEARSKIEAIDKKMAELFEERMQCSRQISELKKLHGLSIRDSVREAALIEKNRKFITDSQIEEYYVDFLKNTIDTSCKYQERLLCGMKVAYCGKNGAFANIAAKKTFPTAQLLAYSSFEKAYAAVENGECDCAVLPLENSYAGEVGTVLDLIYSGSLYINQVVSLPIIHNLIGMEGSAREDIKTVVSHPQALSQCSEYIEKNGWKTISYSNTATAAQYVKDLGDKSVAAIASDVTAEADGLKIIEARVNDNPNNTTRFAVFSKVQNKPSLFAKEDKENFILVFTVKNQAGSLAQTLNILGAHGYNMRSLRSRPMKDLRWNYYFYIEAEGNINTENGRDLLNELSVLCANLKLAGVYSD
ncbi:MAG: chorismate mutase [Clostridia bacterium]|nr:chorismate mutase [Clostridia bacterium]